MALWPSAWTTESAWPNCRLHVLVFSKQRRILPPWNLHCLDTGRAKAGQTHKLAILFAQTEGGFCTIDLRNDLRHGALCFRSEGRGWFAHLSQKESGASFGKNNSCPHFSWNHSCELSSRPPNLATILFKSSGTHLVAKSLAAFKASTAQLPTHASALSIRAFMSGTALIASHRLHTGPVHWASPCSMASRHLSDTVQAHSWNDRPSPPVASITAKRRLEICTSARRGAEHMNKMLGNWCRTSLNKTSNRHWWPIDCVKSLMLVRCLVSARTTCDKKPPHAMCCKRTGYVSLYVYVTSVSHFYVYVTVYNKYWL